MIEVSVGSVTSKGQVTIPKEIRDTLGISEGDKVIFLIDGDVVVLRKVRDMKLSEVLLRQKPWPESSLEYQRRLRQEWQRQ
ncbi:MAG: AbrB/MazE/SpoVT family DNA-binding domain-containing protein [Candidatus Bathyarchaeota archaeon]|nr:AbrB/MazE/SpoVT family DNA-binding domain-containing protein [Candidatus Bathyarchaeota archaeon]